MRIGVELLALIVVVAVITLAWRVSASVLGRSQPGVIEAAQWRAEHFSRDDRTYVVVRKQRPTRGVDSTDSLTVAVIDQADPAWEEKFHEAMATARMRAAALNSETDPG